MRPGVLKASGVSRFSRTVPATSSSVTPLTGATLTTRTGTAGAGAGGGGGFGGLGGGGTADTGDYGIVLQVGTTIVKGKLHVENKGAMGGGSPFGPQNDDERR